MQETIEISKKEYEGMKSTIKTLQDADLMNQITESENNIKKDNVEKFDI